MSSASSSPWRDRELSPSSRGRPLAHAAGAGHFVVLGRNDEANPLNSMAVVYIEMRRRGLYLDDAEEVAAYKLTFDYLRSQAVDASASLRLLAKTRQELTS
ncbi:Scr1 family TA system antitoxin-like transcriptional regulator [Streptomyces sp. NPDC097640]|uniref:Scr1 family TA system antitoxin-like transcriptional regulator n=1 Tax=Streptomyces sp. NPDC097640 TaxID=3157229 RepID=UPI003331FBA1